MAYSLTKRSDPSARLMRKRFGKLIAEWRTEAGLTQRDIAAELGYDYYTQVSQIERGLARIPPEDVDVWARLLRQDPKEFAKQVLYWTDPHIYRAIYGIDPLVEQKIPNPSIKRKK